MMKKNQKQELEDLSVLQTICIRLQKNLIEDLKDLASNDGLRYQPYIRRCLIQHVRTEKRKRR